jgi:hypothetical protein
MNIDLNNISVSKDKAAAESNPAYYSGAHNRGKLKNQAQFQKNHKAGQPKEKETVPAVTDTYERGGPVNNASGALKSPATYSVNTADIARLKADADKQFQSFKNLVENFISRQVQTFQVSASFKFERLDKIENVQNFDSFEFDFEFNIKLETQTELKNNKDLQARAAEMVSDEGQWGAPKTSERILEFAKALFGGDVSKIDPLKDAFIDGFNQVKDLFGTDFPDVSSKTYDLVIMGFEDE